MSCAELSENTVKVEVSESIRTSGVTTKVDLHLR